MAHHTHDHSPSSEGWQSTLGSKGYRLTPQREPVLHAGEHLGHATPDESITEVKRPFLR